MHVYDMTIMVPHLRCRVALQVPFSRLCYGGSMLEKNVDDNRKMVDLYMETYYAGMFATDVRGSLYLSAGYACL